MIKACFFALAGVLLGACYSASATDIAESTKTRCQALPGVDYYDWAEIIRACEQWTKRATSSGQASYYHGRTLFEMGDMTEAIEQFRAGAQAGDRLSTIALHFAQGGTMGDAFSGFSNDALIKFRRMAEDGDSIALVLLGHHIVYKNISNRSSKNIKEMLSLFESASDRGEPVATYLLGSYQVSDKNPDNDRAAIRLLYTAAEDGVGAAYVDLQQVGEIDDVPVDVDQTRYRWGTPMDLVMRQP